MNRHTWGLASAAALALALLAPTNLPAGADTPPPPPTAIAHRGGYADVGRTEDTVGAYVKAASYGLTDWETDIRFDRHGVPFLMHDSPIDRTTNGTGWASSVDIATTTVLMNDGTRLRDQTLARLLSYAARYGATVAIEPKVTPTTDQVEQTLSIIDAYGMRGRVLLDSFHITNLAPFKAAAPELTYSLVTSTAVDPLKARAVGPILNIAAAVLTPELVAAYHGAGVAVWAWTVNDPAAWCTVAALGVDRIVTDHPALYRGWRDFKAPAASWPA